MYSRILFSIVLRDKMKRFLWELVLIFGDDTWWFFRGNEFLINSHILHKCDEKYRQVYSILTASLDKVKFQHGLDDTLFVLAFSLFLRLRPNRMTFSLNTPISPMPLDGNGDFSRIYQYHRSIEFFVFLSFFYFLAAKKSICISTSQDSFLQYASTILFFLLITLIVSKLPNNLAFIFLRNIFS